MGASSRFAGTRKATRSRLALIVIKFAFWISECRLILPYLLCPGKELALFVISFRMDSDFWTKYFVNEDYFGFLMENREKTVRL